MKRCPKCNLNYSDETLIFCLSDGARLTPVPDEEPPTVFSSSETTTAAPLNKTADGFSPEANFTDNRAKMPETTASQPQPERQFAESGLNRAAPPQLDSDLTADKILSLAPIVLALAHNYWQWLYLANSRTYSYFDYFVSVNFIVWLVLLIGGTVISILALRKARDKSFAVTGLIILAINFLLSIVPRRF